MLVLWTAASMNSILGHLELDNGPVEKALNCIMDYIRVCNDR